METKTHVRLFDEAPTDVMRLGRCGYVTYRQEGSIISFAPPLETICPQCGCKHTDGSSLCSTCARYAGEP